MKRVGSTLILIVVVLFLNGGLMPASGQFGRGDLDQKQFLVLVRDALTESLVSNPKIHVEVAGEGSNQYNPALSGETSDGVFRLKLGRGKFRFLISADGYHPLMIEGCDIQCGSESWGIFVGGDALRFLGKTFLYSVSVEPRNGQPPKLQTQPFLSDTIYYHEPETPPEPVGGMGALKKKIDVSRLGGHPRSDGRTTSVYATTSIEKDGSVGFVDVYGEAPHHVRVEVAEAIKKTQFSPAKIVGIPIRSKVCIPFEFSLAW